MEQQGQESTLPAALLTELVRFCKQDGLVSEFAESLYLKRQTVYLWDKQESESLIHRAAKLGLLEVLRIVKPKLSAIAPFAAAAIPEIDVNGWQSKKGRR